MLALQFVLTSIIAACAFFGSAAYDHLPQKNSFLLELQQDLCTNSFQHLELNFLLGYYAVLWLWVIKRKLWSFCQLWLAVTALSCFYCAYTHPPASRIPTVILNLLAGFEVELCVYCFIRAVDRKTRVCFTTSFLISSALLIFGSAYTGLETVESPYYYISTRREAGWMLTPNDFGIWLSIGEVLSLGAAILLVRNNKERISRLFSRQTISWGLAGLLFCSGVLLLPKLILTYSRGAWIGGGFAIAAMAFSAMYSVSPLNMVNGFKRLLRKNGLPSFIILVSCVLLWSFRERETLVARRIFSVISPLDFSVKNRLSGWQGALQMICDRPVLGFGFDDVLQFFQTYYLDPKLEEGAAIQSNDFLVLAINLGVPSFACLVASLWCLLIIPLYRRSPVTGGGDTFAEQICRCGVVVFLVGFWFDAGLFKMHFACLFWILFALSNAESSTHKR